MQPPAFALAALLLVLAASAPSPGAGEIAPPIRVRILDRSCWYELRRPLPIERCLRRGVHLFANGDVAEDSEITERRADDGALLGERTEVDYALADPTAFKALLRTLRDLEIGTLAGHCGLQSGPSERTWDATYSWLRGRRVNSFRMVSALPAGEPPCTDVRIELAATAIESYVDARLARSDNRRVVP